MRNLQHRFIGSLLVLIAGCLIASTGQAAAPLNEAKLQALFDHAVEVSGAVGVQVSIIRDGQQVDFVSGLANAELDIPLMQDTVIQIGSTTKIFNAAIAMKLVEEGKLKLDAPVKTYLPEFAVADEVATSTVNLGQLLSMSSGFDNGPYDDHGAGGDALAKYVASLKTLPQAFEPGQGFGYSNAGTSVAGYVSERVAGKAWDDLLKEFILAPAGLTNAATLEKDLIFQRVSVGHALNPETGEITVIRPWHITRAQGPAGSTLAMSAHDLARFGKLFVNGGKSDNGTEVLSPTIIKTMTTVRTPVPTTTFATAWGLGPYLQDWNGTPVWGHAGGNMSGVSDLRWIPSLNGVLAVTCNTPRALSPILEALHGDMAREAFGISIPELSAPATPPVIANAERYTGTYAGVGAKFVVEKISPTELKMIAITELMPESSVTLVSLGGDRFFIVPGDSADPWGSNRDMAFFGKDEIGRAHV